MVPPPPVPPAVPEGPDAYGDALPPEFIGGGDGEYGSGSGGGRSGGRGQGGGQGGGMGGGLSGRQAPHSPEAERALVVALLGDPERIADVSESLDGEAFFDARYRAIFEAMVSLAERNLPVEFVALGEALQAAGKLHEIGGAPFLVELGQEFTSAALAQHHGRLISETAVLRKLIRESTDLITKAVETRPDGTAVRELLDEAEQRIFEVTREGDTSSASHIKDAIKETFLQLDARTGDGELTGVTTGFYELDDMLSGLNKGELIILAARPSMGKTAFALNLVENAAFSRPSWLNGGSPSVMVFSLEMGSQSLASRMLCSRARVPAHLLRSGRIPGDLRQDLATAADEFHGTKIAIDDTPGLSMMAVRSRARRQKSQYGLDLIIVDYLQLLSFPRSESRQQEISNISRSLKELSRELEVPVVALSQLSRAVESRDPPRPQLSDLRESGSIEQDADVVMMLYRAEYYRKYRTDENRGVAEVIVAKQRNGPTGEVRLQFFPDHMRFENRAPDGVQPVSV